MAYADFVTAIMAAFMALWIIAVDPAALREARAYFTGGRSVSPPPGDAGSTALPTFRYVVLPGSSGATKPDSASRADLERLAQELRADLSAAFVAFPELRDRIEVVLTDAGLRIELREGADGATFFSLGSAVLRAPARFALDLIALRLGATRRPITVEGHTDAAPYRSAAYTNWDLSFDRANAARRELEANGVRPEQIVGVRGYADRQLRLPAQPRDPRNRRITILLPYSVPTDSTKVVAR